MAGPTASEPFPQTGRQIERTARAALRNPWVERLARLGYAARGVVYVLIGILAVQTVFGARRPPAADTEGALQMVAQQSRALLWLLALGLFGYALWRFVQAVLDPENRGRDAKGLFTRAGMLASGVIYGGVAPQSWTADLMTRPFGRWLVALAGIGVMAAGLQQIWSGWTERFRRRLKLQEMEPGERSLALRSGKLGLMARGAVFVLTGGFLLQAAWRFDPSRAQGLGGALAALARQPAGPWLLALAALGLIAFGAYSLLLARYRRIVF